MVDNPPLQMVGLEPGFAVLEVTYGGEHGSLPDPVRFDASDAELIGIATEALQTGIPGVVPQPGANLQDNVVHKYPAKDGLPNRIIIRPKTQFGTSFLSANADQEGGSHGTHVQEDPRGHIPA